MTVIDRSYTVSCRTCSEDRIERFVSISRLPRSMNNEDKKEEEQASVMACGGRNCSLISFSKFLPNIEVQGNPRREAS